jgi:glycosyltransferase involved in cell wall biosynthesis
MNKKVCVSIPVRNCEEFIEQAIISVLSQDYTNLHLNIYDGQSTDNTTKVLQKYEKVKNVSVVYTTNLNSPCRAIKRCLELPDADIIIPLMADDFFIHNSVVSSFINEFKKNNADFVYGNSYVVDRQNISKILRKVKNFNYNLDDLKNGNHPNWSSVAFKKKLIKELDFNDNDFEFACDFDFYIKILSNSKYKICHLDNYTSNHRIGGESSKNILKMICANHEAYTAWINNGIHVSKLFLLKKPLSKIKQFFKL